MNPSTGASTRSAKAPSLPRSAGRARFATVPKQHHMRLVLRQRCTPQLAYSESAPPTSPQAAPSCQFPRIKLVSSCPQDLARSSRPRLKVALTAAAAWRGLTATLAQAASRSIHPVGALAEEVTPPAEHSAPTTLPTTPAAPLPLDPGSLGE
jgi:hypothetical protein